MSGELKARLRNVLEVEASAEHYIHLWIDLRTVFFSLEMTAESVMQRLVSDIGTVNLTNIRSGDLNINKLPTTCVA